MSVSLQVSMVKWSLYESQVLAPPEAPKLESELALKEPKLQNMGLVPELEPVFSMRFLSGDRAAVEMGWDVAVRLANGFSSRV